MTIEITRDGTHMTGTLHLVEPGVGELDARFVGQWTTDDKVSAQTLEHFSSSSGGAVRLPQTGRMEGTFDLKQNIITGHWRTEVNALGEFRWIRVPAPHRKLLVALVAVPMQVARCWGRFAANTKMLFGKFGFTWDKRYTKWLKFALQLSVAGFIGFLVVALVVDFLSGN